MTQLHPETPLPNTPILSYLAADISPTRARLIAGRAVLATGIVYLIVALLILSAVGYEIYVYARAISGLPGRPPLADIIQAAKDVLLGTPFFLAIVITCGAALIQLVTASAIRHGRRSASLLVAFSLFPIILVLVLLTAFGFTMAIDFSFVAPDRDIVYLLLLVPSFLGIFLALLLKDLVALLFWIARNPLAEKPPVPFLPHARSANHPTIPN